jgi:tetratricopeptide (TPR) repeat protein
MRRRLFGQSWDQPRPPQVTRPSLVQRLRFRLFGPPSIDGAPPQVVRISLLSRIVYRLLYLNPFHGVFSPKQDEIDPSYWQKRRWRRLLCSLPAMIAVGGAVYLAVTMANRNKRDVAQWYSTLAQNSARAATTLAVQGNHEQAHAKIQEAIAHAQEANLLNPNDDNCLLQLGEMLAAQGETARAMAIFTSLAPNDRLGYPPAHLSLASLLLRQSPTTRGRFSEDAERHLLRIVDQSGDIGAKASAMLGENYYTANRLGLAITYLQRTPYQSRFRVLLADAAKRMGNKQMAEMAEMEARSCVIAFDAKLKFEPTDVSARLNLVSSLSVLNDYPNAILVCEAGIGPSTPQQTTDALLSIRNHMYFFWLTSLEKDPQVPVSSRFTVLERALAAAPNDPRFIARLTDYTDPKSKEGEAARAMLRELLANGQNIGLAHEVLGLYAWSEKNPDDARTHLTLAHNAFPLDAQIANNFAAMISMSDPPELERALTAINGAIEQFPNYGEFRHTRGMILFRMENWKETIPDLELALSGRHPDQASIHAALAKAYEMVGSPAMAAQHLAKAAELNKKKKSD